MSLTCKLRDNRLAYLRIDESVEAQDVEDFVDGKAVVWVSLETGVISLEFQGEDEIELEDGDVLVSMLGTIEICEEAAFAEHFE